MACGKKAPQTVQPEVQKKPVIRLIAVLPVDNRSSDSMAARLLRDRILEEIYFKGYPKIPLSVVDDKLSRNSKDAPRLAPKIVGDLLEVDAVMYSTLSEWKTSFFYFYARTTVAAQFELRNAKTGETIWKASHKVDKRNYDVTRERLEMESLAAYEPAIHEVVDTAMNSFPEGPDFLGRPPAKGGCCLWNWF
jgi:hypothetical protein